MAANDADPLGDGDQSPLSGKEADEVREVWSTGGDLFERIQTGVIAPFAMLCFLGAAKQIQEALDAAKDAGDREKLLETREGVLRSTPLIIVIVAIKLKVQGEKEKSDHLACVKLLVEAGCRVNARDVAGHTALFHSSGASSDEACHEALKIMCSAGGDINLQNRWGGTSLQEAILGHNLAAIQALLRLGANPELKDCDGASALMMAAAVPSVAAIMGLKLVPKDQGTVPAKLKCVECGKEERGTKAMQQCSKCKAAWYCGKECQEANWKIHKKTCKPAAPPPGQVLIN